MTRLDYIKKIPTCNYGHTLNYDIRVSICSRFPENVKDGELAFETALNAIVDIDRRGKNQSSFANLPPLQERNNEHHNEYKRMYPKENEYWEKLKLGTQLEHELGCLLSERADSICYPLGLFHRLDIDIHTAEDLRKAALEKIAWLRDQGCDMSDLVILEKSLGEHDMNFPLKEKVYEIFKAYTIKKLHNNEEISIHECIWLCCDASNKDFDYVIDTYINEDDDYESKNAYQSFLRTLRKRYYSYPEKVYQMKVSRLKVK